MGWSKARCAWGGAAVVVIAAVAMSAVPSRPQGYTLKIGYYGPRTVPVLYTKPEVRLEAWNEQGYLVSKATMEIDGKPVNAKYDPERKALVHLPTVPLSLGDHQVVCKLTLDDQVTFPKAWTMKIAEGAVDRLPEPDASVAEGLVQVNGYRKKVGLPAAVLDPRLSAAASKHAEYCALNDMTGHVQIPGKPGYVAATSGDRAAAFGWAGGSWEGVDSGDDQIGDGLKALWIAPYHRIPFLQLGQIAFGAAFIKGRTVTMWGTSSDTGVVLSPAKGEAGVPRSWNAIEEPDPFRMHGKAPGPTGWPIVAVYWGGKDARIVSATAEISDSTGASVPLYLNSPANDPLLSNAVIVTPKSPLKNGAVYSVRLEMKTAAGKTLDDRWSFTVAP